MAPLDLHALPWLGNAVALAIGVAFGAILESSGFGDSRRLAAQFYGRDMTVLKVMFGAIITAATLITLSCALGWLDFTRVFVDPTYLWSQIAGGLIMGVGFVVGGYCPGTSVVASSTLKIDGIVFLVGVAAGILAFGESVQHFERFFDAGYFGRFTVGDWLGIDAGWALLLVIAVAMALFWAGELAEQVFGRGLAWAAVPWLGLGGPKAAALAVLLALALTAALVGQPNGARRWALLGAPAQAQLDQRKVMVSPREVVDTRANTALRVLTLDLRGERDYNLFHLRGAERLNGPVDDPVLLRRLGDLPDNSVVFLMGDNETAAIAAWKKLWAEGIPNVYIVEGGINGWLQAYPLDPCLARPLAPPPGGFAPGTLHWAFSRSVGDAVPSAHPDCMNCWDQPWGCESPASLAATQAAAQAQRLDEEPNIPYQHKVIVRVHAKVKGGCG